MSFDSRAKHYESSFVFEEPFFVPDFSSVTNEFAAFSDYTVAGEEYW